jgi:hypothetical protein
MRTLALKTHIFGSKTPKSTPFQKVVLLVAPFFFGVKITTFCNHGLNNIVMLLTKTLKSTPNQKVVLTTTPFFIFKVKTTTSLKPLDLTISTIATKTLKSTLESKVVLLVTTPFF